MRKETRWIWIRHAAAKTDGIFCGRSDPGLLPVDPTQMTQIAAQLPRAHAVSSPLRRARDTLEALRAAGFAPMSQDISELLSEQDFGAWEGRRYEDVDLSQSPGSLAEIRPPQGESFADLIVRVGRAIAALHAGAHADICVVAHAGVIRASLAYALGLSPEKALSFAIEPLSRTGLTSFAEGGWRVDYVNKSIS